MAALMGTDTECGFTAPDAGGTPRASIVINQHPSTRTRERTGQSGGGAGLLR